MRKVIMGSIVFMAGLLSLAVLLAGTMASSASSTANWSAFWKLGYFGLTPFAWVFGGVAVMGLFLALWGATERR